MKNVDVPMWDKGDDTDSFSKGGSSSSRFSVKSIKQKSPFIEKLFKEILGRKPSTREISYYKYSTKDKNIIANELIKGDEHKSILKKAKEYPDLKSEKRKMESTILKLRSLLDDKEDEYLELKRLLVEKNNTISQLREEKRIPYLTNEKILEEENVHYSISKKDYAKESKKEDFFERLKYLLFGNNDN